MKVSSSSPVLLSRRDYARLLGVHPGTLDRWAREGRARVVRTPGAVRYVVDGELAVILAAQRGGDTAGASS